MRTEIKSQKLEEGQLRLLCDAWMTHAVHNLSEFRYLNWFFFGFHIRFYWKPLTINYWEIDDTFFYEGERILRQIQDIKWKCRQFEFDIRSKSSKHQTCNIPSKQAVYRQSCAWLICGFSVWLFLCLSIDGDSWFLGFER